MSTGVQLTSATLAAPIVDVVVYPYYSSTASVNVGAPYYFSTQDATTNAGLRAVEVSKSVLDGNMSTFTILLAPGGPKGVNDIQTWTSILTPMSLVLIGMQRGTFKRIVMVGVVTSSEETQSWAHDRVERTITIQGMDFTYYFTNFSIYQFAALGVLKPGPNANALLTSVLSLSGLLGVEDPVTIGTNLFNFMWGPYPFPGTAPILDILGEGLMSKTQVNYQGNYILLSQLLGTKFESLRIEIAGEGANSTCPVVWAYALGDGNWLGQFRTIFSDPWYEFYIMTASPTDVFTRWDAISTTSNNQVNVAPAVTLRMRGYPDATILTIARIAPPPFVDQESTLHISDWQAVPIFTDSSFIRSTVSYDVRDHKNMIFLMPDFIIAAFGGGGDANLATAAEIGGVVSNVYGLSKYGFRPDRVNTKWFAGNDTSSSPLSAPSNPKVPSSPAVERNQLQYLQLKVSGLDTPIPQMLAGEVVLPLRPDIYPGNRFQYYPFKNDGLFMFYNPGVVHRWEFGREATTTLQLTRGLPQTLYANPTKLTQLILGNLEMEYDPNSQPGDPSTRYVPRTNNPLLPGVEVVDMGGVITPIPNPNIPGSNPNVGTGTP